MHRYFFVFAFLSLLAPLQAWDSFSFYPSMEVLYHPVSTANEEAQSAFNRGLLAIYAFNYDEAVASFDKASQLDPNLAMAYWGMALALDENLDRFTTLTHAKLTYALCQKALALSETATPNEQAYIQALATRFSEDPHADKRVLRAAYKEAMQKVAATYPDDADASVLYIESMIDHLSWDLWTSSGKPRNGTVEIVQLLESVLKRTPLHAGANHYYIHAVENSNDPQRGLMSAERLNSLNLLEWGHLLHTSSHIFMRVGSYEKAVEANIKAVDADKKYIQKNGIEGQYPLKYMAHNLFYLTYAYLWQENYTGALAAATELEQFLIPYIEDIPVLEFNLLVPLQVHLYFHDWNAILHFPEPSSEHKIVHLFWLFARAMAFASLGDLKRAEVEQAYYAQQKNNLFEKTDKEDVIKKIFELADDLLTASIAKTKGDLVERVNALTRAVKKQDQLDYLHWYYPVRQTLGASLLEIKEPAKSEVAFRQALERLPRNGRSLFGLSQALKAQGKFDYWIERESKDALRFSTRPLTLEDL